MEFSEFKNFPTESRPDYTGAEQEGMYPILRLRQDGSMFIPTNFYRCPTSPFGYEHFISNRKPMPFVTMWGDGRTWLTPKPYWQQVLDQASPEDREQLSLIGVDVVCAGDGKIKLPPEALIEMFGDDYSKKFGRALYTATGDGPTIVMKAHETPEQSQQRENLANEMGAKITALLEKGDVESAHRLVDIHARSLVPGANPRPRGF